MFAREFYTHSLLINGRCQCDFVLCEPHSLACIFGRKDSPYATCRQISHSSSLKHTISEKWSGISVHRDTCIALCAAFRKADSASNEVLSFGSLIKHVGGPVAVAYDAKLCKYRPSFVAAVPSGHRGWLLSQRTDHELGIL